MKHKLFKITALFLFGIIIGCSNDDYVEVPLDIVHATQGFSAKAGTATLELESFENATVSSNEEWCTASMQGKSLIINVTVNPDISGRAALLTIKSGDIIGFVTIAQSGDLFEIEGLDPTAESVVFPASGGELKDITISTLAPYEIETSAPWIQYTNNNGVLTFTVGAYENPRKGTVTFRAGKRTREFTITQVSYESFLGTWDFNYTTTSSSGNTPKTSTAEMTVKEAGKSFVMDCPDWPYAITLLYNEKNRSLVLFGGEELGVYGGVYIIVGGIINQEDRINFTENMQMEAKAQIGTKTICSFGDNGSWDGAIVDRFQFSAFNAAGAYQGGIMTCRDMALSKNN